MPPSRGCHACKVRKIKCDESEPQCQRCIKSKKVCPGYHNEPHLVIRDMTVLAGKKVESRVKKVLNARGLAEPDVPATPLCLERSTQSVDQISLPFDGESLAQLTVWPEDTATWQEEVVNRFFADYVLISDTVTDTMNVLPQLYKSPGAGFCFNDALYAAAFVSQANQLGLEWLTVAANEAYGRALATLTSALQSKREALKDTTLAATYLISMYEVRSQFQNLSHPIFAVNGKLILEVQFIGGHRPTGSLMDQHHHRGRMSLLQLRGEYQFSSTIGRCLWNVLHEQAIVKCITWHERPLRSGNAWPAVFAKKGLAQELGQLHFRTAEVCAEAQILFDSTAHDGKWETGLLNIIEDINLIDHGYQIYINSYSLSKAWRHQTHFPPPGLVVPAGQMVHTYHDLWTAYIWNGCRSKRAHIHEVLLHCLFLLECHPEAEDSYMKLKRSSLDKDSFARSKCVIEDMVFDICATIPFMLGNVDSAGNHTPEAKGKPLGGYLSVWPLHVARTSAAEGSEREAWIRERLIFIDAKMGIRIGRLVATRIRREPWNLKR